MLYLGNAFRTLNQGFEIVMLQEVSFPPGAERQVRKELRRVGPEYMCVMEMGRHRGWEEASNESKTVRHGWHSGKQYAVVTFFHMAYFKMASKIEWNTTDTRKGLRHMTEGRVLWAEALTHEGKLIHAVNVHQATSAQPELQQQARSLEEACRTPARRCRLSPSAPRT